MKNCKTTFIFVDLDFLERLLEKKNEIFLWVGVPTFEDFYLQGLFVLLYRN